MKWRLIALLALLLTGCPIQHHVRVDGRELHRRLYSHQVKLNASIEVYGSAPFERTRIRALASSLKFQFPINPWYIIILSQADFEDALLQYHLVGITYSAFTNLDERVTYLNEGYLMFASEDRVRWTLGHEYGHLICGCFSEDEANRIAHQLTR